MTKRSHSGETVRIDNESLCQLIAPFHLEFAFADRRNAPDPRLLAHAMLRECPSLGYAWHLSGGRVYLRATDTVLARASHRSVDSHTPWAWPLYGDDARTWTRKLEMWWRIADEISQPPLRIWRVDHGDASANIVVQVNHAAVDGALLMSTLSKAMERLASSAVHTAPKLGTGYVHRSIRDRAMVVGAGGSASHAAVARVWKRMV